MNELLLHLDACISIPFSTVSWHCFANEEFASEPASTDADDAPFRLGARVVTLICLDSFQYSASFPVSPGRL
jgi:hypothetical protein